MKRAKFLLVLIVFLSGCAGYRYHHGQSPYEKGYVVSRDGYTILEYTLGAGESVPDRHLAKERFKRRRKAVENYYKKMGYIQNRFRTAVWEPWTSLWKLVGGVFRLPFIMVADYKYEHNPEYKKKVQEADLREEAEEEERIKGLQAELGEYIQEDLALEDAEPESDLKPKRKGLLGRMKGWLPWGGRKSDPKQVAPKPQKKSPARKTGSWWWPFGRKSDTKKSEVSIKEETVPEVAIEEKPAEIEVVREDASEQQIEELIFEVDQIKEREKKSPPKPSRPIEAVIIAKPADGFSPLRVKFYGRKSRSRKAKIVSYNWDFGDGDISNKPNPTNIFYSGSFEPKVFTVTLTVADNRGNTDTSDIKITVKNK